MVTPLMVEIENGSFLRVTAYVGQILIFVSPCTVKRQSANHYTSSPP
jgi:hypothetical protein